MAKPDYLCIEAGYFMRQYPVKYTLFGGYTRLRGYAMLIPITPVYDSPCVAVEKAFPAQWDPKLGIHVT